jgi:zinc and cadmium transporter
MPSVWLLSIGSVAAVSALSLVGVVTLSLKPETVRKSLLILISFAAGALLGDAFVHLIPEMAEDGLSMNESSGLLAGVIGFFVLEKVLHWHHSHLPQEEVLHPVAVTNLIGDALHNFVDGAIIAGGFLVSSGIGIATAIAVALHEIPQEIGDFAILMHAGLPPRRALMLNLLSALTAFAGAVLALAVSSAVENAERAIVALTAGGFLYIASSDLIPELHKEPEAGKSALQLVSLLAGLGVMVALVGLE